MALIDDLVEALTVLPGVGKKSAQRMALHLLQRDRGGGTRLGNILGHAMRDVRQCRVCRNLTETEICRLCDDPRRESETAGRRRERDVGVSDADGEFRARDSDSR